MKWQIYLIMALVAIPIAAAIIECENIETPADIPCMIISTWDYGNCSPTQAKIYNSTPTLLDTRNFTDFGASGRCNFTWNISTVDSYFWNVTNGDTGHITVEVDDKLNLAIVIGLSIFTVVFMGIGLLLWFYNRGKEDNE